MFKDNTAETIIIKKGFKISMGWNLGTRGISNHLLDPFTSIPMNTTNTKLIKAKKNKMIEILINVSWFKKEKNNKIIIPKEMKIKCFIIK